MRVKLVLAGDGEFEKGYVVGLLSTCFGRGHESGGTRELPGIWIEID